MKNSNFKTQTPSPPLTNNAQVHPNSAGQQVTPPQKGKKRHQQSKPKPINVKHNINATTSLPQQQQKQQQQYQQPPQRYATSAPASSPCTPTKLSDRYAGPTFHNSPAAAALPKPIFAKTPPASNAMGSFAAEFQQHTPHNHHPHHQRVVSVPPPSPFRSDYVPSPSHDVQFFHPNSIPFQQSRPLQQHPNNLPPAALSQLDPSPFRNDNLTSPSHAIQFFQQHPSATPLPIQPLQPSQTSPSNNIHRSPHCTRSMIIK